MNTTFHARALAAGPPREDSRTSCVPLPSPIRSRNVTARGVQRLPRSAAVPHRTRSDTPAAGRDRRAARAGVASPGPHQEMRGRRERVRRSLQGLTSIGVDAQPRTQRSPGPSGPRKASTRDARTLDPHHHLLTKTVHPANELGIAARIGVDRELAAQLTQTTESDGASEALWLSTPTAIMIPPLPRAEREWMSPDRAVSSDVQASMKSRRHPLRRLETDPHKGTQRDQTLQESSRRRAGPSHRHRTPPPRPSPARPTGSLRRGASYTTPERGIAPALDSPSGPPRSSSPRGAEGPQRGPSGPRKEFVPNRGRASTARKGWDLSVSGCRPTAQEGWTAG